MGRHLAGCVAVGSQDNADGLVQNGAAVPEVLELGVRLGRGQVPFLDRAGRPVWHADHILDAGLV
jgi:hypothetical protein